jgi:transcriptional regulator with XRE-family HTH domain
VNWVRSDEEPTGELARRLRQLRERRWPDLKITQRQIAEALGGDRPLSESLISSWESVQSPAVPTANRLRAYATFFATRRSVESRPARLLDDHELTPDELAWRDELHEELLRLRYPDGPVLGPVRVPLAAPGYAIGGGTWYFPDNRPVVIVCARLPQAMREGIPYADPRDPDYVKAIGYADLDAIIELFGHIRAVNPSIAVGIRPADVLLADDYAAHLVLLGGVDWNAVTRDIVRRLRLPIRLGTRPDENPHSGQIEVGTGGDHQVFAPTLETSGERITLLEDVGCFYRGTSPYNPRRTVTLCNGMYARGTYGIVRALTDARFRDHNEGYVAEHFRGSPSFGIVSRVSVAVNGEALTPDWTDEYNRLFQWPDVGE